MVLLRSSISHVLGKCKRFIVLKIPQIYGLASGDIKRFSAAAAPIKRGSASFLRTILTFRFKRFFQIRMVDF